MTATTITSAAVAGLGTAESIADPRNSGRTLDVLDSVAMGSNNTTLDKYYLVALKSNVCLSSLKIFNDLLDGGSVAITLNVGIANGPNKLVDPGGSTYAPFAQISQTCFASASTTGQAVNSAGTELVGKVATHMAELLNPLWKRAGLQQDPQSILVVQVQIQTVAATAVPAATVVVKATGIGAP